MPLISSPCGRVRSTTELNALIRRLWPHPDKRLNDRERAEYAELVAEWAVAAALERGGMVKAA